MDGFTASVIGGTLFAVGVAWLVATLLVTGPTLPALCAVLVSFGSTLLAIRLSLFPGQGRARFARALTSHTAHGVELHPFARTNVVTAVELTAFAGRASWPGRAGSGVRS